MLTANSGIRLAEDYQAALLGGVIATGAGAFGLNTTFLMPESKMSRPPAAGVQKPATAEPLTQEPILFLLRIAIQPVASGIYRMSLASGVSIIMALNTGQKR